MPRPVAIVEHGAMDPDAAAILRIAGYAVIWCHSKDGVVLTDRTLRDDLAMAAMTGGQLWDAIINGKHSVFARGDGAEKLAELAYAIADAALIERDKNRTP